MRLRDFGRAIVSFLRRYIHRPRVEISTANVVAAVALIVIAIVSYLIRLLPLFGFEPLVRAFDPWYNFREVEFILENGFGAWFSWYDNTTWVPWGRNIPRTSYPGIPFTTVIMYLFLSTLGFQIDLLMFCILFPPIMGTFGVIATYFLGTEVANKETGLLSALFMAILPAYTQRTIAGFYDNEAIGIFAIILCLFFFARSLRKGSIAYAILGGLALGYLSASWSVYLYLYQVLAILGLLLILLRRYSRRLLVAYSGTILGGMAIAICVPRIRPDFAYSTTGLIPIGVFGLMILIELARALRVTEWQMPSTFGTTTTRIRPYMPYLFGTMCALIVVGLGYLFQSGLVIQLFTAQEGGGILGNIAGKFYTVLNPLIRTTAYLLASVGEHLPSPWATFWYNAGFLILLMPFGIFTAFRRNRETDLLLLIFGITALYFTGSMIRLTLLLSPAAAIIGSYGLFSALTSFRRVYWQRPILTRRRRRITPTTPRSFASITYILVLILLLTTTITSIHAANNMGSPEMVPAFRDPATGDVPNTYRDYLEAFSWMQTHTPTDSLFVSWWDYGYWIRVMGNRSTVVDNATFNKTQIAWVGRMMMERNPVEALRICRRFGIDYVLVHFGLGQPFFGGDEGKWQWMSRISWEVFGDAVPNESLFWDVAPPGTGEYHPAFFETMLYHWLYLNASIMGVDPPQGGTPIDPDLYPARAIYSAFPLAFMSQTQLVKIYEVNYTRLDSSMEIRAAGAYPIHQDDPGTGDNENVTSVVVQVQNTGQVPFNIDLMEVNTPQPIQPEPIPFDALISTTGNLTVAPGELVTISASIRQYLSVGSVINVTVTAAAFDPILNATVQVPVRTAPAYNMSAILSECYVYANGTIHIEIENTGEGYSEIDRFAYLEGETIFLSRPADQGLLLFTGDQIAFDLDAADALTPVTLTEGENVTIQIFYMNYLSGQGPNVTITLTVQPTPPAPFKLSPGLGHDAPITLTLQCMPLSVQVQVLVLFPLTWSCWVSSVFFIARRYLP